MEHCALNLVWRNGETPIAQLLQLVSKNKWPVHATIELEYTIPDSSDAVKEPRSAWIFAGRRWRRPIAFENLLCASI